MKKIISLILFLIPSVIIAKNSDSVNGAMIGANTTQQSGILINYVICTSQNNCGSMQQLNIPQYGSWQKLNAPKGDIISITKACTTIDPNNPTCGYWFSNNCSVASGNMWHPSLTIMMPTSKAYLGCQPQQ